jgi:predicted ArsR family transcriptional regulator
MSNDGETPWRFVTNHTRVLLCIAADSGVRMREIADRVGITERAAQRIVADLVNAGVVERTRVGRRNTYAVDRHARLRHPSQADHEIGELIDVLGPLADASVTREV